MDQNSSGYFPDMSDEEFAFGRNNEYQTQREIPFLDLNNDLSSPYEADNLQESPLSAQESVVVKKRTKNFSNEEDVLLCHAWCNTSLDPIIGNQQKHDQFWTRVFKYFVEISPNGKTSRSQPGVTSRWVVINAECQKFSGAYSQIGRISGITEEDKIQRAKEFFIRIHKKRFQLDHCYIILKHHPKWLKLLSSNVGASESSKKKVGSSPRSSPMSVDSVVNLEDDDSTPTDDFERRPMGRNKAKELEKKKKGKEKIFESQALAEYKEIERVKSERQERMLKMQDDYMKLEKEKCIQEQQRQEFEVKKYEFEILKTDTSCLSVAEAKIIQAMKDDIISRMS